MKGIPMKLCIVTTKVIQGDGQGRANFEIVHEALRCGHQVTLIARQIDPELERHDRITWIPIIVKQYPTELLRERIFARQSAAWLYQHQNEFDLVQVNGAITSVNSDMNAVHFVHSAWLRSPHHISRQRQDFYGWYQWIYTRLNAMWEKQAFNQAQVIVAVSEKVKQELVEIGVPIDRIQVIHNGVNLEEFSPATDRAIDPFRQTLGLPTTVPLALFVGDIRTNRKNLDTVLQALVQVPTLHLAVGGAIEGSPYPALATQLGIAQRTHFLGYRRDIADLMRASDFFVFPSRYEACTLVLLEAIASGLPAITAVTAGGCEILTPDSGIVLPDSENVDALAQAMQQLTHDSDRRQQMGKVARTVAEQYSWQRMAASYVQLFEASQTHPSAITVIIPTYRRPIDLIRCLEALKRQERPATQVIVVIRESDTETWTALRSFDVENLPLQTVKVEVPGVVAAMNLGLEAAQGDIIAFTDDDAAPRSDWLTRIEAHFLQNDRLAGVGGRDWIHTGGLGSNSLETGSREIDSRETVGRLQWFGRVIGNHHLGVGSARSVDVLKGVNMSYRRSAIAHLRFDSRMRGTGAQVHFEAAFCFRLRRAGWQLLYDPLVAVDHYPAQRFDEDQRQSFDPIAKANAVHNETLALLEYFSTFQQLIFGIWAILVGTRDALGIVQWLRFLPKEGSFSWHKLQASLRGRWQGWQTWLKSRSTDRPFPDRPFPDRPFPDRQSRTGVVE
jgi:glycosyltransferase involved in cell wall biosynthesis/GT2 family glycosyltransferase